MQSTRPRALFVSIVALTLLEAGTSHALSPDDPLWQVVGPVRPLTEPSNVYMKSVEITYPTAGSGMPMTFHVYDPSGGGLNFAITSKTTGGAVDTSSTFTSVHVSPIARDGSGNWGQGSGRFFSDGAGQAAYNTPFVGAGWYRVQFNYNAVNANRVLAFSATTYAGTPLKLGWADPSGEVNLSVKAKFAVDQGSNVFFKGGAYRDVQASAFAYADNVKVDGQLLYRRTFDQERFDYPVGRLAIGEHTVEATFTSSGGGRAKYWFGVNETSFDPNGVKTSWDAAQFVYDGEMRTGDYDAWNEGVAFAQGNSVRTGVRPPPVRQGNMFMVNLESSTLNGQTQNATLRVYALGSSTQLSWTATRVTASDYAGGIFTSTGFSTRYRELWRVNVPAGTALGRYVLRAFTPGGVQIGADVVFYVLYNPLSLVGTFPSSTAYVATYGYDDDTDGISMELDAPFGADDDAIHDHFFAHPLDDGAGAYYMRDLMTGAMRRTDPSGYSMLDYAVAAASGTTDAFQTMRRLYRLTSQRLLYGAAEHDDVSLSFVGGSTFTPADAVTYSKPGNELAETRKLSGMCYTSAAVLASLARSVGLLARMTVSLNGLGGWGDHGFAEVYMPTLPYHGGKSTSSNTSAASDTDNWYTFDATSPEGPDTTRPWTRYSESVATRAQYGRAAHILSGNTIPAYTVVTNSTAWDPRASDFDSSTDVLNVSSAYQSGKEFWMTATGLTGWLGRGEKDVYRINKTSTGAKAVTVRALVNDGEFLAPKLCVRSASVDPLLPSRCTDAGTRYLLPSGDSYIVVFNDAADAMVRRGDSIQYILELEF